MTDITNIYEWGNKWELLFNLAKCKILSITKGTQRLLLPYHINNSIIDIVNVMEDLGIMVNDSLFWSNHINKAIKRQIKHSG